MTSIKKKIQPARRLARTLARLRHRGRRIVFTNGVYDLMHAGHVTLLAKAKALGDVLVLGLNTDASVRRFKGPKRPITKAADRAQVAAALQSVDYVTFFDEDTPYAVIQRLKPDILVKGGDYAANQVVGRDLVKKVVRIPLVQGRSTPLLIEKILKAYAR
jgi:rfaE bifunctional protein nucleotidyltransferase chain/domain